MVPSLQGLQGTGSAEAEDIGQAVGGNGHGTTRSAEGIPGAGGCALELFLNGHVAPGQFFND